MYGNTEPLQWIRTGYPANIQRKAAALAHSIENDDQSYIPKFPGWFLRQWGDLRGKVRRTIGGKYWWSNKRRIIKTKVHWWQNQWALFKLLPKIKRGELKHTLWFLVNELREKDSSHLTRTGWDSLRKDRGRFIAAAARKGMIAYWPRFTPTLKHERAIDDRSIDGGVIIGLTGIQEALISNRLNFNLISDDQVKQLTRYALNEINGFPEWFRELAIKRLKPVSEILKSVIDYEWGITAEHEHVHDVIAALSYDRTNAYVFFIDYVLKKLEILDPAHPEILSQSLRLVFKNLKLSHTTLCELAKIRIHEYDVNTTQHIEWMNVSLQLEACPTLDKLQEILNEINDPKDYLVRLISTLSSDGRFSGTVTNNPSYIKSENIQKLIQILFKYLPPEEDPRHEPGVAHSVTNLDEAVRFRNGLIIRLSESNADNAGMVLESLLSEDILSSIHDWIRHLILQRYRRNADIEPWTEIQVRIFQNDYEIPPKNPRELFHLICNRLQDIKDWVETGEDSPRGELHTDNSETDVRIWFARKLKEKSRSFYTIPQEHEIASGKRQDIRIEAANLPGPVIIEVKQVEGWSFNKLMERLENQLIGDYLKASNARFGIFLITFTRHNNLGSGGIDPETEQHLTFTEIIQKLQYLADDLSSNNQGIEKVKVLGVDFVNI